MKKFLNYVGLVMFAALVALPATAEAQRLSRPESVIVDLLADGTLSARELTRSQQGRLVPAALEEIADELRSTRRNIASNLASVSIAAASNNFDLVVQLSELIELEEAQEDLLEEISNFQLREVLFPTARGRRNAFNNRQLIRRARNRETGRAFSRLRSRRSQVIGPFIVGENNAINAAQVVVFAQAGFNADLLVDSPEFLETVVEELESFRDSDEFINLDRNSVLANRDLEALAIEAIAEVAFFFEENFRN